MTKWLVRLISALTVALSTSPTALAIGDVALITALDGKVERVTSAGPSPIEAFVKLKDGDRLTLSKDASVRLVYFGSGRQETWRGNGKLLVQPVQSEATGLPPAEVKMLSSLVVRQIAKTPSLDSQGRAGVTRLRAVGAPDALGKLEAEYDRMRIEGGGKDLNAEIFLLSGLFELRELDRVENLISDLSTRQKGNMEAMMLVSLYRRALADIKQKR
jgi:hypothetical protein